MLLGATSNCELLRTAMACGQTPPGGWQVSSKQPCCGDRPGSVRKGCAVVMFLLTFP